VWCPEDPNAQLSLHSFQQIPFAAPPPRSTWRENLRAQPATPPRPAAVATRCRPLAPGAPANHRRSHCHAGRTVSMASLGGTACPFCRKSSARANFSYHYSKRALCALTKPLPSKFLRQRSASCHWHSLHVRADFRNQVGSGNRFNPGDRSAQIDSPLTLACLFLNSEI
jgi:hypothetical protein